MAAASQPHLATARPLVVPIKAMTPTAVTSTAVMTVQRILTATAKLALMTSWKSSLTGVCVPDHNELVHITACSLHVQTRPRQIGGVVSYVNLSSQYKESSPTIKAGQHCQDGQDQ